MRVYMEKNQRKTKWDVTKIILAVVAAVAVLALVGVLGWMVGSGMIGGGNEEPTPTEPSHSATGEVAMAANGNIVATVGEKELTNGQLQVLYWSQVYNFINEYGAYASYFGLDFTKPFSTQPCTMQEGGTWEDFFLEMALNSWSQMATIEIMAEENGFHLSAEKEAELAASIETMKKTATAYGYADLSEMVKKEMGEGATEEDYIAYVKLDYLCNAFVTYLREKNGPDAAQMEEYYKANEATIKSKGFGKDAGKVADVRHILIQPEDGVLNSDGRTYTYTDEKWEAARQKAQLVYDLWLNGEKNETSFADLAKKNSADSSGAVGGLITDVAKGKTVEGFDDWLFAEGREYGDHTLVKTVFGYHIMFYVGTEEAWIRYCKVNYANDIVSTEMQKFAEGYSIKTEYDMIVLGQVDLAN